jgi:aminoglycoside 2'-N-acetyltransferase I
VLGWERWRGPTYVDTPWGRVRTADEDDGILVLRTEDTSALDPTVSLTCDWRQGDVW